MNCNSKMKVDTKHIPKAVMLAYGKNSWSDKSISQREVNIRLQQRRIDENVTKDAGFFAFSKALLRLAIRIIFYLKSPNLKA